MLLATLIFAIVSIIGVIMINKVGNYENMWGMMFYGGAILAIVTFVAWIVVFLISLI